MAANEVIHKGAEYFDENSGVPFVKPAPIQRQLPISPPQSHQQGVFAGESNYDDGLLPNAFDTVEGMQKTYPIPAFQEDPTDDTLIGQLYNVACKLKLNKDKNPIEKIRLAKQLKDIMTKLDKEVAKEKAALLKELGLGAE